MFGLNKLKWFALLLMIVSTPGHSQAAHDQEVEVTVYTECNSSPIDGSSRCVEIDEALAMVVSGMTLSLRPGVHTIHNSTVIRDLTNVSITGVSEAPKDEVIITCDRGQGLSFSQISGLFLSHITITKCGLSGEPLVEIVNILRSQVELFIYIPTSIQIAIFMGMCEDVSLLNVVVTNTTGIGLVGVNILGQSTMSSVSFTYNQHSSCGTLSNQAGGGAYFFYSDPSLNGTSSFIDTSSTLMLTESQFEFNSDCSSVAEVEANYQYIVSAVDKTSYPIGGGGGLSIFMAQQSFPIDISVTFSKFHKNSARFGAGTHIGLFSGIEYSHVSFSDCIFDSNEGESHDNSNGGAGLAVFTGLFNPLHVKLITATKDVRVSVIRSSFVGNSAVKGGGLFTFSLFNGLSFLADYTSLDTISVTLVLLDCSFIHNIALYGAGLSFKQRIDHGYNGKVAVEMINVTIAENTHTGLQSLLGNMDSSAMHLESVTAIISDNLVIKDNAVTGMYIHSSVVIVSSEANVTFSGNKGLLGGAVHLAGVIPVIIANSNTTILFRENWAALQGGAVYVTPRVMSANDILSPLNDECFFLPLPSGKCTDHDCYDLSAMNIRITFRNNGAPLGSAVYGSTLESCQWASLLREERDTVAPGYPILQFIAINFPDVFDVDQDLNTPSTVSTVPSSISVNISQAELLPGQRIHLTLTVKDDYDNAISAVVSSLVSSYSSNCSNATSTLGESGYWFVDSDTSLAIFGITAVENSYVTVTFFTTATVATKEMSFNLGSCPLGVVYDISTSSCICDPRIYTQGVVCDDLTFDITIPNNVWMGTFKGNSSDPTADGDVIIHKCGPGCEEGSKPFLPDNTDSQCSKKLGRSGVLCGGCAPNTSAIFGSFRCRHCSNYYLFFIPVFGLAGILLFVTIAILGFTIDKGWINTVLFYCNILSLYGYIISFRYRLDGLFVPAALLSLQIGTGLCFYDGMTPFARTGLQLIFPIYLYSLMFVFTTLCRRYFWLSERFSPTTTFVTLTIMCYVSTLATCIDILSGVTITTLGGKSSIRWQIDPNQPYFMGYHVVQVLIAAVLLVTYIIPFPILMLFPSLLYRYIKKFKPFYDALWAPFKLKYRFWLGLRLIIRLILITLPRISDESYILTLLILLVLQYLQLVFKPFKSSRVNYVDNFLTGTLTVLILGALYKELNKNQPTASARSVADYIFIFLVVGAGYVTVAGIFYAQLSVKFAALKPACSCLSRSKSTHSVTPVTHTEVALSDIHSATDTSMMVAPNNDIYVATGNSLGDLPQSYVRVNSDESDVTVTVPGVLRAKENFSQLRESLLESSSN